MGLFDKDKAVELRVLGPRGKPYVELENEFTEPFRKEGFNFLMPRLFSASPETTVFITIGIGVITGVSTHLLVSFIDKIFKLKKEKENCQEDEVIHPFPVTKTRIKQLFKSGKIVDAKTICALSICGWL